MTFQLRHPGRVEEAELTRKSCVVSRISCSLQTRHSLKWEKTLIAVPATIQHGKMRTLAQDFQGCSYLICDGQAH